MILNESVKQYRIIYLKPIARGNNNTNTMEIEDNPSNYSVGQMNYRHAKR